MLIIMPIPGLEPGFTLVNLLLVLLVAWISGALASRLGYPAILGELGAGILFGPAVLGLLHMNEGLRVLAEVGVFLMMLYIGMEVDHRDLFKASWAGLLVAVGGLLLPFALGYYVCLWFGRPVEEAIFVGIALGVTALVVNSRILMDLKLLGTRVASVLIAGALITDTAAIVIFAGLIGVFEGAGLHNALGVDLRELAIVSGKAILFFSVTTFLGLKAFPYFWRQLTEAGFTQRTANFTLVLLVALVFAGMAELAGLHAILGAFLAGLFLREEVLMRKLSQDITSLVQSLSIGFLAPVFFVTVGFEVSLDVFRTDLLLLVGIIVAATAGKIGGTLLFYLPTGRGWREGFVIGTGMNGRGAVEIIFAGIGLRAGIIGQDMFSMLVFMAFFTTATVPFLLQWGAEWLRRRGELVSSEQKRAGTIIVGAGPLARALARELDSAEPVHLVDTNLESCALAREEGLTVVNANALREETLATLDAGRARRFIAMTSNREVNEFSAQLAADVFAIPEIHVPHLTTTSGGDSSPLLFGGRLAISDWNRWIARLETERLSFVVMKAMTAAELLREINVGSEMLPLVVVRGDRRFLFHAAAQLEAGDEVVSLLRGKGDPAVRAEDRLDRIIRDCPILDLNASMSMDEFFALTARTMAARINADEQTLLNLLLAREHESSTVILPGVAVPHILIEGQHTFDMLLARCRQGIHFPGANGGVRMVFMLIGTRDERNFHLRCLSAIGQLFQQADLEQKWLDAEGVDQLRDLVMSVERRRL